MQTVEQALMKLERSKFRSSFHLTKKEKEYIQEKGMETIERHTRDLVHKKIGAAFPENDGKQTPMHGHPTFKAMHACGCCCRGCLEKWYHVPKGKELTPIQEEKIVHLLLAWINKQMETKEKA